MEDKDFDFKKAYEELMQKHSLPEFKKIAEDFDIEKIQEKETTFLLREIQRTINEKIMAYIQLFETLMNPTSPPMFIFSLLRNISNQDREIIKETYKTLSKIQIEVMNLDTIYNEANEIKFINKVFNEWQKLKITIHKLIENFEANFETNDTAKERSYFG